MAEIKVDITNNGIFGYECPICGNEEIELGQNFVRYAENRLSVKRINLRFHRGGARV